MADSKSNRLNLVRIVREYYMMKSILNNEAVQKVLKGEVESDGTTPAKDYETLRVMNDYINELGQMKIRKKGLDGKYITLDEFLNDLYDNFVKGEEAKVSGKIKYSENPFEDEFTALVTGMLSMENAEEKIRGALNLYVGTADKVSALPILLGGKKQSSYISLLAQYIESFGAISELQNQIDELEESGKDKDAKIAQLKKDLKTARARANEFKALAEKTLSTGTTREVGDKGLAALLEQSIENMGKLLTGEIQVEGRMTRKHITNEADRVIDEVNVNTLKLNRIENQIRENSTMYPNSIKVLTNMGHLTESEMKVTREEVVRAAGSIGISEEDEVVSAYFNALQRRNDDHKVRRRGFGSGFVSAVALAAVLVGGTILAQQLVRSQTQTSHMEIDYDAYIENENAQKQQFIDELNEALENGTFYDYSSSELPNFDNISTEGVDLRNPTVKDYHYFQALLNKFAEDDNISVFKVSSTDENQLQFENAQLRVISNYYEMNYNKLLEKVASLNSQIERLTAELEEANANIQILQGKVEALEAQVKELKEFLEAAEQENAELKILVKNLEQKIEDLNTRIGELETENEELREENATLNEKISQLTTDISKLLEEIKQLKYDKSLLLNEVADLNAQIYRNEKYIAQLQEQLQNAEGGEYEALQNEISQLQEELEEARQEISELISTNEALKSELVSLQQELSEALVNYNQLLEQYNELLNSGTTVNQEELAALRAELAEAYSTIASYESKIVAIYNGLTGQSTTNENAMQDLEKLLNLFGIDYSDKGASSYSSSGEYVPGE